jgi:signal transduction histidine kinase
MTDAEIEAMGPLPRTHGLLGAMLTEPTPYRTDDITADPRFQWWPAQHPRMRSFLGVPIVSKGTVVGAFYLTNKEGGPRFTEEDQHAIELLAAYAAIAIENAQLFELTRELSIVEERTRLARELHDAINQTLFSLVLVAEAGDLDASRGLARTALTELRAVIEGLRPPALEKDGLAAALRHYVDVLRSAHRRDITLEVSGGDPGGDGDLDPDEERDVLRIAQEALGNALRHAFADEITVMLDLAGDPRTLVVRDNGVGFDPSARAVRARHLGLESMRARARRVGGKLQIMSAPGAGTIVQLEWRRQDEGAAPAADRDRSLA